ncbi:unnamed protein product [Sphagnum troendelagicum]|uniref:nucleoside-diphosphate kinase n=1 Tax=Sphagnum troendelagicum TaxID=128251 RepID=A0ABP0UMV9_9BRYO
MESVCAFSTALCISLPHALPPHSLHDLVPHAGMHQLSYGYQKWAPKCYWLSWWVGEIISRFECKGFVLTGLKLFQTPEKLAQTHDFELKEKQFYPKLVEYIISSPVICMVSFQVSSNFQALWIKDSKLVDWAQQIIPWLHE